jgi:hypothetical protein
MGSSDRGQTGVRRQSQVFGAEAWQSDHKQSVTPKQNVVTIELDEVRSERIDLMDGVFAHYRQADSPALGRDGLTPV